MPNFFPYLIQDMAHSSGACVNDPREANANIRRSYYWTPETGPVDIGLVDGNHTIGYAINRSNQIVGNFHTADGANRFSFIWTPGSGFKDLGRVGSRSVLAHAVNDAGVVAGSVYPFGTIRASRWRDGSGFEILPVDGTSAIAINSSDTSIVRVNRGFDPYFLVWHANGSYEVIEDTTGRSESIHPFRINDDGQVLGEAILMVNGEELLRPFIWQDGGFRLLEPLAGMEDERLVAWDMSDTGTVVGTYADGFDGRAFVWTEETGTLDLASLVIDQGNLHLGTAWRTLEDGRIVADGNQGHMILTPVPEPGTWAVILCGLAALWKNRKSSMD